MNKILKDLLLQRLLFFERCVCIVRDSRSRKYRLNQKKDPARPAPLKAVDSEGFAVHGFAGRHMDDHFQFYSHVFYHHFLYEI